MKQYTRTQLRNLVTRGGAKDITQAHDREAIPERYQLIGEAHNGITCNGKLFKGESGQLYAITDRTQAIYIF